MKRILFVALLVGLLIVACAPAESDRLAMNQQSTDQQTADQEIGLTVYRAPTWGCCGDWIAYMEENGYAVQVEDVPDLVAVKNRYQVPPQLQSCHTAIVDGYIIEGHVPVAEVERLLTERPEIAGLAVPGMPIGSPGMEVDGAADQPFDVIAFDTSGKTEVFASYGQ